MEEIREQVRKKYAAAITEAQSCCGGDRCCNPVTGNLYQTGELDGLPGDLVASSFGCGNPTALATLHAGETVLDLGSVAGLDVLLSAKRVGPAGKAYGLDMTDEMLAAAGFTDLEMVTTRTYDFTDERGGHFLPDLTPEERQALNGALISAFIRAKKPAIPLRSGVDYSLRPAKPADLAAIESLLTANGLPTAGVAQHLSSFIVAAAADGVTGASERNWPAKPPCSVRWRLPATSTNGAWAAPCLLRRLTRPARPEPPPPIS